MKWIHNKIEYETQRVDWVKYIEEPHDFVSNNVMVYHTKWDRCYYIKRLIYDRNRIKVQLCDIYHTDKFMWSDSKHLELVIKVND